MNGVRSTDYEQLDIHLCEECGKEFEPSDDIVSISDGKVMEDVEYDIYNRRFWHKDCFEIELQSADTDDEREVDAATDRT